MTRARLELQADSRQVRTATQDLERLNGTGERSDQMVRTLRKAFIALGGAAAVRGATRTIADFSQQISTVAAISGATTSELKALRQETLLLGSTTRFSASEAAAGAQFLARAGFDTQQILASLNETLTLAQAGGLELAAAADIASNVLTGFRISADEAGRAVDVLAFAANRSNTDVQQLGDALSFVAPIASGLGVSLEETTAAIGALSDAGLQGSTAGTGLRRVLSTLESPTTAATKKLNELGVSAEEVQISTVGLTGALERLRAAGITTGEALEIFGDRGGPAFEVLNSSIPRVREMSRALGEAGGFAQGVADIMDDNLNGALLSVRSATEGLVIALGDLGAESSATQGVSNLADAIRTLTDNLDTAVRVATVVGAVFGARLVGSLASSTIAFTAARIEAARYQATLASMAGVSRGAAASQLVLSRSLSLLGGPAGLAALAAFGVFRLSQSYRDGLQAQDERTQRIMAEFRAQKGLNEEISAGTAAMNRYQSATDSAYAAQIQGMSQSQIQEEFDNVTESLERAERRLERVGDRFAKGTLRYMQAEEAVRAYKAQLEALNGIAPNIITTQEQQDQSLQKVRQSFLDQIFELENGRDAYELLNAAREAGIDIDSAEADGLRELQAERNKLTEAVRAQAEEERKQKEAERAFDSLTAELQTAGMTPAQLAQQQYDARVDVIRDAEDREAATKAEARAAEIQAYQDYQRQLAEIDEQAEQQRIQKIQNQLSGASQLFGDLNSLANAFGDEQNAINRALFIAQKGFSIAQSIIAIQTGIAQAAALPFPANLGAMATVASATAGIVSNIQSVAAPRAAGGQVRGGEQYLVGERGPELITMRGNGNVTPNHMLGAGGGDTINQNAQVSFVIPTSDEQIRRVVADSRDIIYDVMQQVFRRQGRVL